MSFVLFVVYLSFVSDVSWLGSGLALPAIRDKEGIHSQEIVVLYTLIWSFLYKFINEIVYSDCLSL